MGSSLLPVAATMTDLVVDYSSPAVRAFFHIYILVILGLIKVVGGKCCAAYSQGRLVKDATIPLHHMTGWLSGQDALKAIWRLRALPVGFFGLAMLATSAFLIADTLIVATLIRSVQVQTRCPFGIGMVVASTSQASSPVLANGSPALVASQAQTVSLANGGLSGIYKRVNRNLNFSAMPQDVYGSWNCAPYSAQISLPASADIEQVSGALFAKGLMYSSAEAITGCFSEYQPGYSSHMVVMASSIAKDTNAAFNVHISIDLEPSVYDDKTMQTFECTTTGGSVDAILEGIDSYVSLANWCYTIQGAIYNGRDTPASPYSQQILEANLNSITMVGGGDNYLLSTTDVDDTLGCVLSRTTISWAVISLVGGTTALLLVLVLYLIILSVWAAQVERRATATARYEDPPRETEVRLKIKKIKTETPANFLDWMALASKEAKRRHEPNATVTIKELKEYEYGQIDHYPAFGVLVPATMGRVISSLAVSSSDMRSAEEVPLSSWKYTDSTVQQVGIEPVPDRM